MKKIPTIFVRDWAGTIGPPARFVLDDPHPDCAWVFAGEGVARQKLDGTACLVRDGVLYKRHEAKPERGVPSNFEEIEYDEETGKRVGWVPVGDGPEDRWHREAFARSFWGPDGVGSDGTYELVGPKVQGNPEGFAEHTLISHDLADAYIVPREYRAMRDLFAVLDVEGFVFHHDDGRMAKIKGKDFGLGRKP